MGLLESLGRFGAALARSPRAIAARRLDRAAAELAASLGPVGRQLHRVGDRARDGLLDVDARAVLDAWRRLDLVGRAETARDGGSGGDRCA